MTPTPTNAMSVPQPGRDLSRKIPARKTLDMRMITVPTVSPVRSATPAMNASSGATPHAAANIQAKPVPRATAPSRRDAQDRGFFSGVPRG